MEGGRLNKMRIGLSVYGTVFSMGISPASGRSAIRPIQLLDRALIANLEGVELPVSLLQGEDVRAVARYAQEHGLFITLAAGGYMPDKLAEALELGARLSAGTVRTVVGGAKIGGDRRPLAGRWQSFLEDGLPGLPGAAKISGRGTVQLALEKSPR